MTTKTKQKPRIGDTCWLVEWCSEAVLDEDGQFDHDATTNKEHTRRFASKAEAEQFAREVYPQTVGVFGVVSYHPVEFVPYAEEDADLYPSVGYWKETADSEHYDGED